MPNLQDLGRLRIGETVKEIDRRRPRAPTIPDLTGRHRSLRGGAGLCLPGSLASILEAEEEHLDWLETQLKLLSSLGEANFLSLPAKGRHS